MRLFGRQPTNDQQALGSERQSAAQDLKRASVHEAACQAEFGAQLASLQPVLPPGPGVETSTTGGSQQPVPRLQALHSQQAALQHGQQRDEVAAAAQQIAYHAGAASLARQGAITLQEQVWCT